MSRVTFAELEFNIFQKFLERRGEEVELIERSETIDTLNSIYLTPTYHKNNYLADDEVHKRWLWINNEEWTYKEHIQVRNGFYGFISGGRVEKGSIIGNYEVDFIESIREDCLIYKYRLIRKV